MVSDAVIQSPTNKQELARRRGTREQQVDDERAENKEEGGLHH